MITQDLEKYRPGLLALFRQRGQEQDAEDLTQEVFLRVWRQQQQRGVHTYTERQWTGYLMRCAKNLSVDTYRRQRGKAVCSLSAFEEDCNPVEMIVEPLDWIAGVEQRELLATYRLSQQERKYVQLRYAGHTFAESAAQLGLTVAALRHRVYAMRARCQEMTSC